MLESLISQFGYPIILLGTFLEGEMILILGSFSAHLGYLSLKWVITCGFIGTVCGDQLYFFLGRKHGKAHLNKHPGWVPTVNRILTLVHRHQVILILGFRFLYGVRTITPFAIGMSEVSYIKFTLLNIIGAGIWAISIGVAGYYFGNAVESVIGHIKHYEIILMSTLIMMGMLIWLIHFYRRYRHH